ncbi:transporter substrate-binding domain-containing protein [Thermatribacter velox]|uniref:Transporter substrate-binding domain-containing protein n=1 Tax=Thermatribacter velox TaxID=3039681 RepID=A0ABZ2YAI7_9BACT
MNRVFLSVVLLVALSCVFLGATLPLPAQETQVVQVVSGDYYPPFFWLDEEGNPQGITVDLLEKLEEKTLLRFEITALPFASALEKTASGQFDMINLIFKTPEREKQLLFSQPVLRIEGWVYARKNISAQKAGDLNQYLIGAVEGDASVDALREKYPTLSIALFPDYERLMQEARSKRLHAFLVESYTAQYYLTKYDLNSQFRPLEKINEQWAYFAFPLTRQDLVPLVNQGLSKIADAEWEELLAPYALRRVFMWPHWLNILLLVLFAGSGAFLSFFFWKNSYLKKEVARRTKELQKAEREAQKAYQWFQEALDATYALRAEADEKVFLGKILQLFFGTVPGIKALLGVFLNHQKNTWNLYYQDEKESLNASFALPDSTSFPKDAQKIYLFLKSEGYLDLNPMLKELPTQSFTFSKKGTPLGAFYIWGEDLEQHRELLQKLQHNLAIFYLLKHYSREEQLFEERTISAVLKALEYHDPYTEGHSGRVAHYAQCIARMLGINEKEEQLLRRAGLLHDIGKIAVPRHILTKKTTLDLEEYEEVKKHSKKSYELIKSVEGLTEIAEICLYHHERFDGAGYPEGKDDDHIPPLSRILAVADSFDAMTSERPYRRLLTFEEALLELRLCAGGQFDPQIVAEILKHSETLREAFESHLAKR